jgi:glycosyltransferase involved in cell wall biosynthesis
VSIKTIRRARKLGLPTILQTGSAHVQTQYDLIAAEVRKWNIEEALPHPRVLQRALAEYEAADVIVAPSRFVTETFIAQGVPEEKLRLVPWAAAPVVRSAEPTLSPSGQPRILFVGACSLRKGIPSLLESARALRGQARFRLVGQPNPRLFSRLGGLPDNVVAVGHVTGEQLAQEFRTADIFVLPSIEDGSALVTIEAMLAGLPIVVSDQAGAALITEGESGFEFQAGNADALSDRLLTLIEDSGLRARMGEAARQAASPRTPQVYGNELLEEVYAPLMIGAPP